MPLQWRDHEVLAEFGGRCRKARLRVWHGQCVHGWQCHSVSSGHAHILVPAPVAASRRTCACCVGDSVFMVGSITLDWTPHTLVQAPVAGPRRRCECCVGDSVFMVGSIIRSLLDPRTFWYRRPWLRHGGHVGVRW